MSLPEALREALRGVRSVGVVTGAGISAESGIPTYRGKGGVYDDPEEGDRTVEALSGETLRRDPDRTWRAVATLARSVGKASPNAAHRALVTIEARVERFVLLTQNVDGLHQAAGSRAVIDLHGTANETVCLHCGAHGTLAELGAVERTPECEHCGGPLRPDVVLFGELLPPRKVARMQAELYLNPPDLVMAVGTSALFPYIAEPLIIAAAKGRVTVEINPEQTLLSPVVGFALRGPAGHWLPQLAEALAADRAPA
jgi:NAD-dependent deacetylase